MNENPKILFLLHLPPPFHGSSIVGLNIKNDLVINQSFECSYVNLLASKGVSDTGKINLRKIFGFIITLAEVFKLLLFRRPKLCYLALTVTGAALYKDLIIVILLKVFSVKRLYHLHNKGVSIHKNNAFNRIVYNYIFKNAEVIILSKHLYADIQDFVPVSKLHICANGVDDESNSGEQDERQKQSDKEPPVVNILFLSNLIKSKGVFILLEALALLKPKKVPFKCVFIGSEGDVTSYEFDEQKAKLELNDSVSYEGKQYGTAKRKAFLSADIFAFPTYYENECFPLVLLEALSYSLPIVTTFEGGIKDIVEDGVTGFLIPQENTELLAQRLEQLITNRDLREQMGAAGRKRYENEFSKKIFANRLTKILNDVIQK